MDLSMPCGSGLEASRHIARDVPGARVLILSAYQDDDTVQRVVASGVAGYLTKHSAADELLTAIREVGRGNVYYSPKIAGKINARLRQASRTTRESKRPQWRGCNRP